MKWMCPKCKAPLEERLENNKVCSLVCEKNHLYDVSKQGHVNLILANDKSSKLPGDSKAMIKARMSFLSAGYYSVLSDALARHIEHYAQLTKPTQTLDVLDCGCGEGYYGRVLCSEEALSSIRLHGMDISKYAVQKAASTYNVSALNAAAFFAVASSFNIPLLRQTIDVAFSVFAPFDEQEIKRVLKPGGIFIRVLPGPNHLAELKRLIYAHAQAHTPPLPLTSMELILEQHLDYNFNIHTAEDFDALLMMTPFNWATSETARPKFSQLEHATIGNIANMTASFVVQVFKHDGQ